jgi:hypothetical protein
VKAKLANLMHTDKTHFASASSSYLCGICVHVAAPEFAVRLFSGCINNKPAREMRETLRTKQQTHVSRYESGLRILFS